MGRMLAASSPGGLGSWVLLLSKEDCLFDHSIGITFACESTINTCPRRHQFPPNLLSSTQQHTSLRLYNPSSSPPPILSQSSWTSPFLFALCLPSPSPRPRIPPSPPSPQVAHRSHR